MTTITHELLSAYRFHRDALARGHVPASDNPFRLTAVYESLHRTVPAMMALIHARADVAAETWRGGGEGIYPAVSWDRDRPGIGHVLSIERAGLRLVGRVVPESYGGRDCWDKRGETGWFTDPSGDVFQDGHGYCWGAVYQLPSRNGKVRFVAGYEFGGTDAGPTVDFRTIYKGLPDSNDPADCGAARKAAYAADDMAREAAESECRYQTAWQAGQLWAELGEEVAELRGQLRAVLAERRAVKGVADVPTICSTLRDAVSDILQEVAEKRRDRAKLAKGDYDRDRYLGFWTGDPDLRAAFNDGASETVLA